MAHNNITQQNRDLVAKIRMCSGIIAGSLFFLYLSSHIILTVSLAANISLLKILVAATLLNPLFLATAALSVFIGITTALVTSHVLLTAVSGFKKLFTNNPPARDEATAPDEATRSIRSTRPDRINDLTNNPSVVKRLYTWLFAVRQNTPARSETVIESAQATLHPGPETPST